MAGQVAGATAGSGAWRDGRVLGFEFGELRDEYGFTGEGEEKEDGFVVGPGSRHPMLRKLEY